MALSGMHITCGYVGAPVYKGTGQALMGKLTGAQTMASPGTATPVAPEATAQKGDPAFQVRASADSYVSIGPAPDASSASSLRHFIPANETVTIYAEPGDKIAWILVPLSHVIGGPPMPYIRVQAMRYDSAFVSSIGKDNGGNPALPSVTAVISGTSAKIYGPVTVGTEILVYPIDVQAYVTVGKDPVAGVGNSLLLDPNGPMPVVPLRLQPGESVAAMSVTLP